MAPEALANLRLESHGKNPFNEKTPCVFPSLKAR